METKEIVASMLVENTGRHMLDSGGAYGRSWERNQAAVAAVEMTAVEYFESRPDAFWSYGPTLDVYHFLVNRLDYNEKLDRAWNKWVFGGPEDRYINGISTADEFIKALDEKGWTEPNDECHHSWVNTYNGEDLLTQTLQYVTFVLSDECPWGEGCHVLLSIHNGADVRGGYSSLVAFEGGSPWDDLSIWDNARASVYCDNVEAHRGVHKEQMNLEGKTTEDIYYHAYTDDGYHWYCDDFDEPVPNEDNSELAPKCPLCGNDLEVGVY